MPTYRKILFAVLCGLFLVWQFVLDPSLQSPIQLALAAPDTGAPATSVEEDILTIVAHIFELGMFVMYVCIYFLSILLDPETIFEINEQAKIGGASMLLVLWQTSRDIMNVIFVFMLAAAAIYTAVTAQLTLVMEKYKKFVLAVILVNFSWFFPQVILDSANILTATVYTIPQQLNEKFGLECKTVDKDGKFNKPCLFIKKIHFFPEEVRGDGSKPPDACQKTGGDPAANILVPIPQVCLELAPLPKDTNTSLGILHGLYVNHAGILKVGEVVKKNKPLPGGFDKSDQVEELIRFITQFLFVVLYFMAVLFPLVTLLIIYFLRIPIIWITTAFMPFMFLGFVMGDKMGNFDPMQIFKKFVSAAFMPAITAVPLVVGFVMITAGIKAPCPKTGSIGGLCLEQGFLINGVKNFWVFLWNCTAIVVMWMGFFAAAKMDSIYAGASEFVQGIGKNWGKFALKSPLALPVLGLPGSGGKNKSVLEAMGGSAGPAAIMNPNLLINRSGRFADPRKSGTVPPDSRKVDNVLGDDKTRRILQEINQNVKGGGDGMLSDTAKMTALAAVLKQEKVFDASQVKPFLQHSKVGGADLTPTQLNTAANTIVKAINNSKTPPASP